MPSAAGLYYFVHEVENTARPPVLLIHGAGGSHLSWPPQVRRLSGQRVFAVDLPGHGRSENIGRQTIREYSVDMLEFMKAAGLPAAVVVGHSMGGAIALSLALNVPQRVLGLGLIGCGAKLRVSPAILEAVADPAEYGPALHLVTETSFGRGADARMKELAEQRMAETRAAVLYGDFLACDSFDVLDDLRRIRVPALILCGGEDRMTPLNRSQALHEGIPGSDLQVIPNAGHMLMLEQPAAVAEALSDFLDDFSYQPGQ